jgi:hypothetical protein
MKWSHMDILFRPKDHPEMELFKRNMLFVVKLPIGRHKVAKTLIDNGASLNFIMRKTIIDMGLNLKDSTPRTRYVPRGHPRAVINSHWVD